MKTCNKCKVEKEIDGFYKKKAGKYGVAAVCKKCKIAINKSYQKADKPYVYIASHNSNYYIGCSNARWSSRFSKHKNRNNTGLSKYIEEHKLEREELHIDMIEFNTITEAKAYESFLIKGNISQKLCLNKRKER